MICHLVYANIRPFKFTSDRYKFSKDVIIYSPDVVRHFNLASA